MIVSQAGARFHQLLMTKVPTTLPRVAHFIGNLGDNLAPEIVARALRMPVVGVRVSASGRRILAIGSILGFSGSGAIVCGAGAIQNTIHQANDEEILLVRGPLTAGIIRGAAVPLRYGDPALLAPELFRITPRDGSKPLYIPHYVDFERFTRVVPAVHVMDVRRVGIMDALNRVAGAGVVIASSLHGLILAHAFGKPTVWIEPSPGIKGKSFKFLDYFASQNHSQNPLSLEAALGYARLDKVAVSAPTVNIAPIREAFDRLRERLRERV